MNTIPNFEIGASSSLSSGAQAGKTGDINLSGGGTGSSLLQSLFGGVLPKTTPNQSWITYAALAGLGVLALIGFIVWTRH